MRAELGQILARRQALGKAREITKNIINNDNNINHHLNLMQSTIQIYFTAVRLKCEQIQLVSYLQSIGFVFVDAKRLFHINFLEQGDRKNL